MATIRIQVSKASQRQLTHDLDSAVIVPTEITLFVDQGELQVAQGSRLALVREGESFAIPLEGLT